MCWPLNPFPALVMPPHVSGVTSLIYRRRFIRSKGVSTLVSADSSG